MTDDRRPIHLAVLLGVSAGAYAVTLAGVTALQAEADAHVQAQRSPIDLAATVMADDRAALEAAAETAAYRYAVLADRYRRSGLVIEGMEVALDDLALRAGAVAESAASLPTRFALPSVRSSPRSAPRPASAPATQATTRASG